MYVDAYGVLMHWMPKSAKSVVAPDYFELRQHVLDLVALFRACGGALTSALNFKP